MTTTPRLWKSLTQVNTTDAPPPMSGGLAFQVDGQVAPLADGGYVVVWTDLSRAYNPAGQAVVGQRYDAAGNKVGSEVDISGFDERDQFSPAIAALPNGNVAGAFVDTSLGEDIYVRVYNSGAPAIWLMNGSNVLSNSAAGPFNPGPGWQIKATGDFNGDNKSDILWQGSNGTPAIWLMDGTTALSVGTVGPFNPG